MFYSIKEAHKWLSMQLLTVATFVAALLELVPELKSELPDNWYLYALILIGVGRMYKPKAKP